jgi:branched-chain amino acid transport system ATP-binding protein
MNVILEVERIGKRFGGLRALEDISFAVPEGAIFGIIGANGAGKTTLFNILSGAHRPTAGRVWFDQRDVTGLPPSHLCALGIARTFQIARPFPGLTALDTVRIGAFNRTANMGEATQRARDVLDRLGLAAKAMTEGRHLTVVERKRLELARAYATRPRLLLLDEVAAGLRPHEVHEFVDLIRSVAAEGITVLIIEHVLTALFALAQQIVVINHGKKIAVGTPDEIARHKDVIEAYLGAGYAVA